ncbi:uncharacterized protein LOC110452664 [Mizuhopecten yessoensis]|uniref:uncharacterized protein LOC110452664 n=1 Tax=Mizuhopecten yessoensis TaxID=6573 RepID=UPI000B45964C|nr:uncharacterized protein LOC110452664 [Mizuhopecten yessoensis]
MIKGLFKFLWEVFLKDIAKMLGYRSPKAQLAAHAASDHHKSFQMVEIALFGMADELLLPYFRERMAAGVGVSAVDFMVWMRDVASPNFLFMVDIVFTYLLSVYVFRAGIRRNNSSVILSSRASFTDLFYGLNMTHYQELELTDLMVRAQAPPQVKHFLAATESFSVSGNHSKGEAGDFILEAKNRRCKMWMPPGVPTEQRWLRVCRNFDRLEEIRANLLGLFDLGQKERDMQHTDLTTETFQWRLILRSSGYLSAPKVTRTHTSISGEALDEDLINFKRNCQDNRKVYNHKFCEGSKAKLTPIFVLPADRTKFHHISRKTKGELEVMLLGLE